MQLSYNLDLHTALCSSSIGFVTGLTFYGAVFKRKMLTLMNFEKIIVTYSNLFAFAIFVFMNSKKT